MTTDTESAPSECCSRAKPHMQQCNMRYNLCRLHVALFLVALAAPFVSAIAETPNSAMAVDSKLSPPSEGAPPSLATPPDTSVAKSITKRRPLVEAGLRYSSNDWLINFITAPTSFILHRIRFHVFFNVALSLLVVHLYPRFPKISIPMLGHTLLASSLGLLLSYRTNSAYSRFWEARGHWTDTKATCRNMALVIRHHVAHHSPKAAKQLLVLLAAYPSTLMHLCLGGAVRLPNHAAKLIPSPDGADEIFQYDCTLPAMYMCTELHKAVHEAYRESRSAKSDLIEAEHLVEVSHGIGKLMQLLSKCEKILKTPVPWTYSRHTSRFLTLWMGTLPFALVGQVGKNGSLVVGIVMAASYCMFGIEEISHLIEQPFLGDPLDGDEKVWTAVDEEGEAATLIKRGRKTQPYDIGIPVCSLAAQIRKEVQAIAGHNGEGAQQ